MNIPSEKQAENTKYLRSLARAKAILSKAEDNHAVQLSDQALRVRCRLLVPTAIKRLGQIISGTDDKNSIAAAKIILDKILPDLKALQVEKRETLEGLVIVRHENSSTVIDMTNKDEPLISHND